jgi:8-oxo-dGTP pyrophosphatase MutT (NUDIX family)
MSASAPSRHVFTGRVIEVVVDRVLLPNGVEAELEVVRHPGGAAVVALDETDRICLLRQFRHAAGGWLWELPAGKIDDREPPLETARRELAEEAGVEAREWRSLGVMVSSPGVFTEVVHLYLATGLRPVPAAAEPEEVMEIHWVRFADALRRAVEPGPGDELIRDAKSALAILRAAVLLGRVG